MAFSKCAKRENGYFEVKEIEPYDSAYKLIAVQCRGCGAPFGVTGYYDTGFLLKQQEKKLEHLDRELSSIKSALNQIANRLR